MTRPSRPYLVVERPETPGLHRVGYHAARWAPLFALALATYILFPAPAGHTAPVFDEGQVAPTDVLAPFDFVVRKPAADLERERAALAATVRPIWEVRPAIVDSVRSTVHSLFAALAAAESGRLADSGAARGIRFTTGEATFLAQRGRIAAYRDATLRMVNGPLAQGVAADGLAREPSREIMRRRAGLEQVIERDALPTFTTMMGQRGVVHPAPNSSVGDQVFVKVLHAVFRPTAVPNTAETEQLRLDLRASVDTVKDRVRQHERIVAAHEVVTPAIRDRLLALRGELARQQADVGVPVTAVAGRLLGYALVLGILWLLLLLYRRETYSELRQVYVIALIVGLVIGGAAANARFITDAPELIPIPFAAMLLTALFSGRLAMLAAALLAILLAGQTPFAGENALVQVLVGGVAGAVGMRVVRRRTQLLATMGVVLGAYALGALALGLQGEWSLAEFGTSVAIAGVNALISTALVGFALPVFETAARVTTDVTLLELSDPSRPLLRRLATEAPGTYAHSISMANLCEAACDAIGANGLLARVGCYYHDIGKVRKPQFFVENQSLGVNPHDKLKPDVSAAIIRNHVKDGVALAEEARLPPAVVAFIPEHHGTAEIAYFLERARAAGDGDVPPDQFRYPGPKPRSVETAVAMLADGVEAAVRVLDEPSPARVRDAIAHLVRQRVASGELRDAPLTLAQLARVEEEFVRVLTGVHHSRIDYPSATGGLSADWPGSGAS
ncbi:MAG: HDIG domain-containing metalloprotein [Gemmatimonadales bacterium]